MRSMAGLFSSSRMIASAVSKSMVVVASDGRPTDGVCRDQEAAVTAIAETTETPAAVS